MIVVISKKEDGTCNLYVENAHCQPVNLIGFTPELAEETKNTLETVFLRGKESSYKELEVFLERARLHIAE